MELSYFPIIALPVPGLLDCGETAITQFLPQYHNFARAAILETDIEDAYMNEVLQ